MSLLGTQKKAHKNGLLHAPNELLEILAVYQDGKIFFTKGKRYHPAVLEALANGRKAGIETTLIEVADGAVKGHYDAVVDEGRSAKIESYEKTAHQILSDAAASKAADIKIIRTPEKTIVRFIIAGQEINYNVAITSSEGNALISFIFDSRDEGAGHSTKMQGEFQGFSVSPVKGSNPNGLRLPPNVLKLRCQKGFHETTEDIMDHVAIRVFYRESDEMATLEDLGLDPMALDALQRARDCMKGAIMIGGETGDGKSTTIISAVKQQYKENNGQISIVTVEDPVEYKLDEDGIVQIPIQSSGDAAKRTQNYRAALMHFVRINPHVGMVSEVRDAEAARQVLQFIETGHQVWTTIHINSVNSIPFRLIDMGIEPTELSKPDSLTLMMKQTLVPLLCRCSTKGNDGYFHRNTDGCGICRDPAKSAEAQQAWAGLSRMVAVSEYIEPDDKYLSLIRANDAIGAKNYWEAKADAGGMGGITLKQKLHYLAALGGIDPKSAIKKGAKLPKQRDEDLEIDKVYVDWIGGLMNRRKGA